MEQEFLVAVYGSLRQGMGNHRLLEHGEATKLSTEHISGFLMYSMGGFPYIRPATTEDLIVVEVYKVDASTMRSLDRLEGYPSFYDRKLVPTSKGEAWVYFIDEEPRGREPVVSGDWVKFRRGEF